jgi:hypothetical protein
LRHKTSGLPELGKPSSSFLQSSYFRIFIDGLTREVFCVSSRSRPACVIPICMQHPGDRVFGLLSYCLLSFDLH